jgi:hypothetical protein
MSQSVTEPSVFSTYSAKQLADLWAHLSPEEQAEAAPLLEDALCGEWAVSHTKGMMLWLRSYTKTFNFQWREQNLSPEAPFPYKPYPVEAYQQRCKLGGHAHSKWNCCEAALAAFPFPHEFTPDDLPDYFDMLGGCLLFLPQIAPDNEIWIPKTRQMLTSWLAVGYVTWYGQFRRMIETIGQSEDDLKAQGNIKYANALYVNQPEWMKQLHPLKGSMDGTLHKIEWANGSLFRSMPSGIRKLASSHPHIYFNDESSHQAGFEATLNVAKPAVSQVICVSSVAPGPFWNEVASAFQL